MKIYDCFLFFNELELLELRLELLYPHVDYFIISECDHTFSGLKKPFYFDENKERYSKYLDKIIHVKVPNSRETVDFINPFENKQKEVFDSIITLFKSLKTDWKTQLHWCLEFVHRECVRLGMTNCEDDDIIIFSDLDEIPNPKIFSEKIPTMDFENIYVLVGDSFSYYMNVLSQTNWHGAYITKYKNIKNKSVGLLRGERESFLKILDSSWHFTNMGGEDRVITKVKSWGHQEYNSPTVINSVKQKMENLTDLFGRTNYFYKDKDKNFYFDKMILLELEVHFPKELVDFVKSHFPSFIKKKN